MTATGSYRSSLHGVLVFTLVGLVIVLGPGRPAGAGYTVQSSSGSVQYLVNDLGGPSGSASFAADGTMLAPGGELPAINGPTQASSTTYNQSDIATAPLIQSEAGVSGFGTATTELDASTRGTGEGSRIPRTGIFYDQPTFVQSPSPSGGDSTVSVSVSKASATFLYTGSTVSVLPGMVLNLNGNLSLSGVVEAGLRGTIKLNGPGQSGNLTTFSPIILGAQNGEGGFYTYYNGPNGTGGFTGTSGSFSAIGAINLAAPVTLQSGDTFTITSTLTIASDPNSTFSVSNTFPPDPVLEGVQLPDIGVYAALPVGVVPEPSAYLQLGIGVVFAVIWMRRALRRAPAAESIRP